MTIETISDLIHEYMYDWVNDSNNSNDGRNVKHVQDRPLKNGQKSLDTREAKNERSTKSQRTKTSGQRGALVKTTYMPSQNGRVSQL